MRFALMIEPQQGLTYDEQLAIVARAEAAGFEAFFRSDHYQSFPGPIGRADDRRLGRPRRPRPRDVDGSGSGALVSPVTFRQFGNLAKVVTTVDEMSGGRIEFGLGAGWNDVEHRQLGLPFPEIEERADMLEEQLAVLHGLWGEPDGWSFEGKHVTDRRTPSSTRSRSAVPGRPIGRTARRGRGSSPAARARRGRCGSPPATPTSSTSRRRRRTIAADEVRRARGGVRGDRPRSGDDDAARRWPGC